MSTSIFLTFLTDPLDPDTFSIVASRNGEIFYDYDLVANSQDEVVTHDAWMLVEALIEIGKPLPKRIVEINLLERFLSGVPQSEAEKKNGLPWDTYRVIKDFAGDEEVIDQWREIFWLKKYIEVESEVREILKKFVGLLSSYYQSKVASLDLTFKQPFNDIEVPVHNALLEAQYRGVKVDGDLADQHLSTIDNEYYRALSELKDKHSFLGGPFDSAYLTQYFKEGRFSTIFELSADSLDKFIKYNKDFDARINLIGTLRKLKITKNVLLKASCSSKGRIFPVFNTFGTVTGRVQVVEPALQHIKKKYRDIIVPDDGYELLYIDFSQFEPCVLAHKSGDARLIELVNTGDLYEFIAGSIFKNAVDRDCAKSLFIQYSYGASSETLTKFVLHKSELPLEEAGAGVSTMLNEFSGVSAWKQSIIDAATSSGYVDAGNGVLRKFKEKARALHKARRQMVNHMIQASGASLIKLIILDLLDRHPDVQVMIPMFDALFLQAPVGQRQVLEDLFVSRFSAVYPGMKARVSICNFDESPLD